jgi:hypothetical protein
MRQQHIDVNTHRDKEANKSAYRGRPKSRAYANKRSSKNNTNDNDLLRQNQETSRSNAFKGMTMLKYRVKTSKPTAGTPA